MPCCRIDRNSNGEPIEPESIVYFLYIRSAFEGLGVDDRVYATLPPTASPKKKTGGGRAPDSSNSSSSSSGTATAATAVTRMGLYYDSPTIFFADQFRRFPAEITHAR